MSRTQSREHAHELIDRMAPGQVSAVVGLLEIMLDPFARTLANAPYDDEPITEREAHDAAAAKPAFACGETVGQDDLLADFGLTQQDFDRMARTPLDFHSKNQ